VRIDGQVVVTGSFNFTKAAEEINADDPYWKLEVLEVGRLDITWLSPENGTAETAACGFVGEGTDTMMLYFRGML